MNIYYIEVNVIVSNEPGGSVYQVTVVSIELGDMAIQDNVVVSINLVTYL